MISNTAFQIMGMSFVPQRNIFNSSQSFLNSRFTQLQSFCQQKQFFSSNAKEDIISNPVHELVQPGQQKIVGGWLFLTAGTVFFMVVLGGYTRLSHSGLSMTKWKPIQYQMPSTADQWEEQFKHYQQFPQYQIANKEMSVDSFKRIFFVEWLHRAVGSTLGFMYGLPLALFLYQGWVLPQLRTRLLILLALGGSQGLIGWWMVKSGMDQKPDYQTRPRVSVYRLSVHLNTAITIYSLLLWNGMSILRQPQEALLNSNNFLANQKVRVLSIGLIHFIAYNIITGSAVAGIDAGQVYNTWPDMNGVMVPDNLLQREPWYCNFFENHATVQFNHRIAAYLTWSWVMYMFISSRKLQMLKSTKFALWGITALVNYQLVSGIITLLNFSIPSKASPHQATALLTLTNALYLAHTCRNPSQLFIKSLGQ